MKTVLGSIHPALSYLICDQQSCDGLDFFGVLSIPLNRFELTMNRHTV